MIRKQPDSNVEWKLWGLQDPLWGVASWKGKQKSDPNPWEINEFYRTGEIDWSDFLKHWVGYGLNSEICLEIGCGAGRITRFLAECFQLVIAVDVSEYMLAIAHENISNSTVNFLLVDGIHMPFSDNTFSAIFSTHVFQHLDSIEYASLYFSEIARILRPGGTMMIHIPIFEWHPKTPRLSKIMLSIRLKYDYLITWIRRRLLSHGIIQQPFMRYLVFPLSFIFSELNSLGLTDIEISIFLVSTNRDLHPFIFARKFPK